MASGARNAAAAGVASSPMARALQQLNPIETLIPPQLRGRMKDFFAYCGSVNPLPAGATVSDDIQIQADSDFLILAGIVGVRDAATGLAFQADAPITVSILDTGSGRQLNNEATDLNNLFGTGREPAYWTMPKLIKRSSTIQTVLGNLDPGNGFIVRYSYVGIKVFPATAG